MTTGRETAETEMETIRIIPGTGIMGTATKGTAATKGIAAATGTAAREIAEMETNRKFPPY